MITVKVSVEGLKKLEGSLVAKQMNKQKLANEVNIARSTVTNFFLGRSIQRKKAEKICKFLGILLEDIILQTDLSEEKSEDITKLVERVHNKVISSTKLLWLNVVRVLEMQKPIPLDEIYVDVRVWDDFRRHNTIDEDSPVSLSARIKGVNAVKKYKRLMILGQPGSGKTTFLRHLATLQNFNVEENGTIVNLIPIIIILRDYAYRSRTNNSLSLFNYIKNELLNTYGIYEYEFNTLLKEKRIIFLLDGLDEVTDETNLDICGEIRELLNDYPTNRFVISCRNAAKPFKLESFTEVQISDFDNPQVREFIENWFDIFLKNYKTSKEKIQNSKEKLIRQIEAQSANENRTIRDYLRPIKDFTQTPLLLTMLCLVVTIKGEIPSGRLELYKKSLDIFWSEWDAERGIKRTNLDGVDQEQILSILSDIALKTHLKQETIISQLEIENSIRKHNNSVDPLALISFIQSHYGILVNSSLGCYSFYHTTFQEYFAALKITKSENSLSYIDSKYIGNSFWREVLTLVIESFLVNNQKHLVDRFIFKILNNIKLIQEKNIELNKFIEQVDNTVDKLEIKEEKTRTSLRVFLLDPDYYYDSSRTLLMELDKNVGNKLVASSFINRLFLDKNPQSKNYLEDFLRAFQITKNIPGIEDADNADHALQIIYEFVKSKDYCISYQNCTWEIRDKKIKSKLDEIYNNNSFDLGKKAEKCREVCLEYLKLDNKLGLDNFNSLLNKKNSPDYSYQYLYNATLLLAKALTSINKSSIFSNKQFFNQIEYSQIVNYFITPSNELEKLIKKSEKAKDSNQLNEERRFKGQLTDEYSLWQSARPHLQELRRQVKKLLINFRDSDENELSILEIGCGSGELTEIILSDVKNIKVIAIDNEPSMISKIRSRLSHFLAQGTLSVVQKDALTYLQQCQPNSFHFVISGFTFHNMLASHRSQVLQKLYDVLLLNGKLLDVDKIAQRGDKHQLAKKWQYDKFFEVLGSAERFDLLKEVMLHYAADEEPDRIRYEDETISELLKIGFQEVNLYSRQHMDAIIVASK